jgi:hypothetical protein
MRVADLPKEPTCTFCGQVIDRPKPPIADGVGDHNVGRCQCGAVYASDPTGHNVGSAMVEALVYASGNWDLAWELVPEDDYLTGRLEDYDELTHQVVENRNLDGRRIAGTIYFVRLHREAAEVADRLAKKNKSKMPKDAMPELEPARDPKREKIKTTKAEVAVMVENNDIDGLVTRCFDDLRTLRFMQRLLYDPSEDKRWWTVHVIGQVCARFSTRQPGPVSDMLHRLFEASSDSAATNWGLIETIGAIIAGRSDIYGAFARHLLRYAGEPSTQIPMLWSLGTIARQRPDLIRSSAFYRILGFLQHPDPAIRGHMIRILGPLQATEARPTLEALLTDSAALTIYEDGRPQATTVAALAEVALAQINQEGEPAHDRVASKKRASSRSRKRTVGSEPGGV